MGGANVTVLDEATYTGLGGRPDSRTSGIRTAMPDPDGYQITEAGGATGTVTYTPINGGLAGGCQVVYTPTNSDPVTAYTDSC